MSNLLILSSSTGEGHNSAAFAVADEWVAQGGTCEVIDAMSFGGERPQHIVSNAYNSMVVKWSGWFGRLYRAGEWYSETGLASPVYAANTLYAKRLRSYITDKRFDAVLCTHLFPMEALTHLKRKSLISLPCFGVLTDYTCIPFFEETGLDAYFSPHPAVTDECVSKGMPGDSFINTGMPVSCRFTSPMTREQARNYLVISNDVTMYLVMTGGMGCGNALNLCGCILCEDPGAEIYVLTGRNDALNRDIRSKYGSSGNVHPVVFTEKVSVYMRAANVLLTKPGGSSSTEAAVAGVPTVHTAPIPGCKAVNAEFFSSRGMSVYAETFDWAAISAKALAQDPDRADIMRTAQARNVNLNAAADIVSRVREA